MFKIFTVILLVISFNVWGQSKDCRIYFHRCGGTLREAEKPLFILDGVPFEDIPSIDPKDIERIEILKGDTASVLAGATYRKAGIIVIQTKNAWMRRIEIRDNVDNNPIPGATVMFINGADTISTIADDNGIAHAKKLRLGINYRILVSSVGYTSLDKNYYHHRNNEKETIFLERSFTECFPVIIKGTKCFTRRRIISCIISRITECEITKVDKGNISGLSDNPEIKIFPIPVSKGKPLTFVTSLDSKELSIQLFTLSGALVYFSRLHNLKNSTFQIPTSPQWSAGTYFLRILDQMGKVRTTTPIIIQ